LADEYRLRFKKAVHLITKVPRQKGYSVLYGNTGRMVTFINLLNHRKHFIKDLCDTFEHEDLHCALWRINIPFSYHDDLIELIISVRKKSQKQSLKSTKKALFYFYFHHPRIFISN